jgi:ABC-type transport system substrate-binding protein
MVKKFKLLIVFSLVLVLFFGLPLENFGEKGRSKKPRSGGVFRLKAFTDEFRRELDPVSADSFIFISEQLFDGLVRLDKNLNIVPHLAEYWEISPDGIKYTFYLRKGIKFHHGAELSAEDVKYSLERLIDKKTDSPYYQFFLPRVVGAQYFREGKTKDVEGFKVLDDYTFEIHWTRPFVSALYLMSMHFCKILPKDLVLDKGRGFFYKPSGTGPFKFDYWIRTTKLDIAGVRMIRNEEYFGGKPYLDAVEFCPHYTLDHFFNGEIHSIPVLTDRLLKSDFQIFQDGLLHKMFLGMSCHTPPLDRLSVRKAISCAIDKAEVVQAASEVRYLYQVTNNYIPPRLQGFLPKDDEVTFDVEQAKHMLREAGFSSENKFPGLTFLVSLPRTDLKFKIYRELRKQLGVVGIKLRIQYYKSLEELKNIEKPYLVYSGRLMNFPDPDDIVRPLFFSKSIFNVFQYSNPELDRLLQEAEIEKSRTRRISFFHKIEQILISDVPAFPLFTVQNRIAMQPYVRGVEVPPLGFYHLDTKKIWLDK